MLGFFGNYLFFLVLLVRFLRIILCLFLFFLFGRLKKLFIGLVARNCWKHQLFLFCFFLNFRCLLNPLNLIKFKLHLLPFLIVQQFYQIDSLTRLLFIAQKDIPFHLMQHFIQPLTFSFAFLVKFSIILYFQLIKLINTKLFYLLFFINQVFPSFHP